VEAVLTLLVDVPRAWLRRSRAGLWYGVRDLPPERIRRVFSFAELTCLCVTVTHPAFGQLFSRKINSPFAAHASSTSSGRW
jgi:hypothetical protein